MLASGRTLLRACTAGRRALTAYAVKNDAKSAVPKKTTPKAASKGAVKEAPSGAAKEEKIARALSAFNLFSKAKFQTIKKENPDAKFTEAAKLVRQAWLTASPEVKAPFEVEAAQLKASVQEKRAAALAIKKANARPPTAFMLYAGKHRSAVTQANPGKPVTEIATLLGKAWKELSPEEQQKYKDESKQLLEAWKAKNGAKV